MDADGPGRRAAFVSIVVGRPDCVGTLIPMNNTTTTETTQTMLADELHGTEMAAASILRTVGDSPLQGTTPAQVISKWLADRAERLVAEAADFYEVPLSTADASAFVASVLADVSRRTHGSGVWG